MASELDNLVRASLLKRETPNRGEYDGLLQSGQSRLADAKHAELSIESKFDLAYNAVWVLSLAALRRLGYRPDRQRYVVFQALRHTLGLSAAIVRRLDNSHRMRNSIEYEGVVPVDERMLADLIDAADEVSAALAKLPPPPA